MDLIPYINQMLSSPNGTAVSKPGTAVVPKAGPHIIDGEWSELPRMLSGPAGALAKSSASRAMLESMFGPMGALISAGDGRADNSASDMQALQHEYATARTNKLFAQQAKAMANRVDQPSVPLGVQPPAPPAPAPGAPGAPSVPISLPNNNPTPPAPPAAPPGPPGPGMPGAPSVPISLPNNSPHPASASGQATQMPWWASGDMTKMFDHVSNGFAANHPVTAGALGIGPKALPDGSSIPGALGPTSVNGAPLNPAGPTSVNGAPLNNSPPMGFFARNSAMMQDPMGGGFIDPAAAQAATGPSLIDKMLAHLQNKDMG